VMRFLHFCSDECGLPEGRERLFVDAKKVHGASQLFPKNSKRESSQTKN